MAKIGATAKGGNNRQALTDLDRDGRDLFVRWCEGAGCTVRIDAIGNIFARRAGRDDGLAPVVTGSHLDTQPTGGRFDGVLGVLAGLEVVRSLNDLDVTTERPIEVAVWTNEEGCRFAPAMIASGVFAGVFELDYALGRADPEGLTMGAELARIGYAGDDAVGGRDVHAYFETHIEQGPDPRGRGQDHRHRHRRAGPALVRAGADRRRIARRADADGPSPRRAAGCGARRRPGQPDRPRPRAAGVCHRGHGRRLSQFAQRHPRPRVPDGRLPPPGRRRAVGDGRRPARRDRCHCRRHRPRGGT